MALPGPVAQILVAFNNNPLDDPALITTVATPAGTLGANNVWTDITPWVKQYQIQRGRQHELQSFQAGTLDVELLNVDPGTNVSGRFNSWNSSGPYFGLLGIRKLVQVRATWNSVTYNRFTGHTDAWPTIWDAQVAETAKMHATDAFRLLGLASLTSNQYASTVIADGATGYWRLGDVAGSVRAAPTVSTVYGNINASATQVTFGQSSAMPADPGTSAAIGAATSQPGELDFTGFQLGSIGNCTIDFWVNIGTLSNVSTTASVFSTCDGTHFAAINIDSINGITITTFGGGSLNRTLTPIVDGNWHHIAATFTADAPTALYFDGVSQTIAAGGTNFGSFTLTNISIFPNTVGPWLVQEFAVYPSVLSGAQILKHYNLGAWRQESTDTRVGHVLNTVGWSAGARNLDTGVSTVQAQTSTLTTTPALNHLQDVETTEGGAIYMDGSGKVRFISRADLVSGSTYASSQVTFGDGVTDVPFQPNPTLALDDIDLYTEASGQRQGGNRQIVSSSSGITSYGRSTFGPPGNLIGISDLEVLNQMQYVLNNKSTPHSRLSSMDVNLASTALTTAQVASVLALELLYRVTVERTILQGSTYSQVGLVEMITETVTPNSWTVTLGLDVAGTTAYWVLGTSTLGQTTALYY